jgi:hypothetical protein
LIEATRRYRESFPGSPAAERMAKRGLAEGIEGFRLGYVDDPLTGHEMYRGRMAIPYLRWSPGIGWSVASIRFRCVTADCPCDHHRKYMTVAGDTPRLYNTPALLPNVPVVGISEGEIDAISATVCGIPTVGVAGVETWKKHFREPFLGYETVYIFADGDTPGEKFAEKVKKLLPNGKIVPSKQDMDVNDEMVQFGPEYIRKKAGL